MIHIFAQSCMKYSSTFNKMYKEEQALKVICQHHWVVGVMAGRPKLS